MLDGVDVVIVPAGLACLDRLVTVLPHARVLVGEPDEDARDLYERLGAERFLSELQSAARRGR